MKKKILQIKDGFLGHHNIAVKPKELTLELTTRCNSKCSTCNIWKKKPKDMSTLTILDIISSKTFKKINALNLTGGEPFLYPHLDFVINSFKLDCKKLRHINFVTNGVATKLIVNKIIKYLSSEYLQNITFSFRISLDSIDNYKKIRGIDNKYVLNTIKELKKFKQVKLSIGLTIQKQNITELNNILKFAKRNHLHLDINHFINIGSSIYGIDRENVYTPKEIQTIIQFLKEMKKYSPYKSLYFTNSEAMYYGLYRGIGCMYGYSSAYFDVNGNLKMCIIAPNNIGTSEKTNWFNNTGYNIRDIVKHTYCINCMLDCAPNWYHFLLYKLFNKSSFWNIKTPTKVPQILALNDRSKNEQRKI